MRAHTHIHTQLLFEVGFLILSHRLPPSDQPFPIAAEAGDGRQAHRWPPRWRQMMLIMLSKLSSAG